MGSAGYAAGQQQDVLADVLRPQLHQLRRLPDGPQRAAQPAPVVRRRQRDLLGHLGPVDHRQTSRPSAPSPGGRPTPAPPAPPATSRTSRRSSPPTRSSSPRTAGAATSPGPSSPRRAATGRAASSTSTTSSWSTRPRPVVSGVAKVGATADRDRRAPGSPTDAKVAYQWYANGVAIPSATKSTLDARPAAGSARRSGSARRRPSSATRRRPSTSASTAAVLPGVLASTRAPVAQRRRSRSSGRCRSTTGAWNVAPDSTTVQWYADGAADRRRGRRAPSSSPRTSPAASITRDRHREPGRLRPDHRRRPRPPSPVALGTIKVSREPSVTGTAKPGPDPHRRPGRLPPGRRSAVVDPVAARRPAGAQRDRPDVPASPPPTSAPASRRRSPSAAPATRPRRSPRPTTAPGPGDAAAQGRASADSSTASGSGSPCPRRTSPVVDGTVVVRVQGGFRQGSCSATASPAFSVSGLPPGKRALRSSTTAARPSSGATEPAPSGCR